MPEPTLTRLWSAAPCSAGFALVHQEVFWPLLSQKVRDGGDSSWLSELVPCMSVSLLQHCGATADNRTKCINSCTKRNVYVSIYIVKWASFSETMIVIYLLMSMSGVLSSSVGSCALWSGVVHHRGRMSSRGQPVRHHDPLHLRTSRWQTGGPHPSAQTSTIPTTPR